MISVALVNVAVTTGFLLGIRHALDADHVLAVSTVVKEKPEPWSIISIGFYWGLGHALTLGAVSLVIILLDISISSSVEAVLEGMVGVMLIVLGVRSIFPRRQGHQHPRHRHSWMSAGIGAIHGLAGSAAFVLLVVASAGSSLGAMLYVGTFSIGTVLGMILFSMVLLIPLRFAGGRPLDYVSSAAGVLSILLGLYLIREAVEVVFG